MPSLFICVRQPTMNHSLTHLSVPSFWYFVLKTTFICLYLAKRVAKSLEPVPDTPCSVRDSTLI
jgi:hypothetical protein